MDQLKKVPRVLLLSLGLFSFLFFQGCTETKMETTTLSANLVAEGPFFAGGNSFMANHKVNLSELVSQEELKASDIKAIKLSKASVSIPASEEASFDLFNNTSLQLVSDAAPMTSIAVLNPIPSNSANSIDLVVSEEADLTSFFQGEEFTILLDFDFIEDDYRDAMNANIDLELTIEYK